VGNLHDKTVKKLIKEKPSIRHADGDWLYLLKSAGRHMPSSLSGWLLWLMAMRKIRLSIFTRF